MFKPELDRTNQNEQERPPLPVHSTKPQSPHKPPKPPKPGVYLQDPYLDSPCLQRLLYACPK